MPWDPGTEHPLQLTNQECNGSISLVELIPSCAGARKE